MRGFVVDVFGGLCLTPRSRAALVGGRPGSVYKWPQRQHSADAAGHSVRPTQCVPPPAAMMESLLFFQQRFSSAEQFSSRDDESVWTAAAAAVVVVVGGPEN